MPPYVRVPSALCAFVAFLTQTVSLEDCTVRFELWVREERVQGFSFNPGLLRARCCQQDTAGQERYRSLAPMYYRGAAAAVVVFDVTNRDTFEGAKSWVRARLGVAQQHVYVSASPLRR